MALKVGALPYSEWQLLTPLLEAMGWESDQADGSDSWYTQSDASDTFGAEDVCLLLYSPPERCLAQALNQGTDLRAAVTLWQSSAEHLLALRERSPVPVVLVEVKTACEAPRELLSWLMQNQPAFHPYAHVAGQRTLRLGYIDDGASLEHNLNRILAVQTVHQGSAMQRLADSLAAVSAPFIPGEQATELALPRVDVLSTQLQLHYAGIKATENRLEGRLEGLREAHQVELRAWQARAKDLDHSLRKAVEDGEKKQKQHREQLAYHDAALERFAQEKHEELEQLRQAHRQAVEENRLDRERQAAHYKEQQERLSVYYKEQEERQLAQHQEQLAYHNSEIERFSREKQEEVRAFRERLNQLERDVKLVDALVREREQLRARLHAARLSWLNWLVFPARWSYHLARSAWRLVRHRSERKALRVVEQSSLFNAAWYIRKNPDLIKAGASPARHYVRFGAYEGRDPGPEFSSAAYLRRYPDIAKAGINPLVHYELYGKKEGRRPR